MLMHMTSYQSDRAEKVKQLEAVLASQVFNACVWVDENNTKTSNEVAMLMAKHGKPLTFYG